MKVFTTSKSNHKLKGLLKGKHSNQGDKFWYHIIIMHMLNVTFKRVIVSSRDVLMEETHIKEKYRTKHNELVFKAQFLQTHLQNSKQLALTIWGANITF